MSALYTRRTARDTPNVVVAVAQKLAEDIDCHDAQAAIGLNFEHRHHCLIENGVADVLRRVGVGCDLAGNKEADECLLVFTGL